MAEYYSKKEIRKRALKFCQGYYFGLANNEDSRIVNGLSRLVNSNPLDEEETEAIVGVVLENPEMKGVYKQRFRYEIRERTRKQRI